MTFAVLETPVNTRMLPKLLAPIESFLQCSTPPSWLREAAKPENLQVLLVDHCNCELKAAQTGLFIMRRYALDSADIEKVAEWTKPYEDFVYQQSYDNDFPDKKTVLSVPLNGCEDQPHSREIIDKMLALVKEELHHFEQVVSILRGRGMEHAPISASRYARGLIKQVRTYEPAALVDKLIIGAYIEARSCERFAKVAPLLDDDIGNFYLRLLKSESRHFQDYLSLAEKVAQLDERVSSSFRERVAQFGRWESELITSPDENFRFHSGAPC